MAAEKNPSSGCCGCQAHDSGRRKALGSVLALALSPLATSALAQEASGTRSNRPEPGDRLAFMIGDRKGQEIKPEDVVQGKEPVLAYPLDPSGKLIESRIAMLTVVRILEADMNAAVKANAVDGIVAYSSLCTHYGCPITTLDPTHKQIVCNCHGSVFDAGNRGVVTAGPATRRLAMLPLKLENGSLVVAGKFDGPLGPPT